MAHLALYLHMIPVIGLQQMLLIGIFLQDGRTAFSIIHSRLVAIVAAETGGGVVVATIAEIVHLKCVTAHEDAATPLRPAPDIAGMGVAGEEETVEVTQAVAFLPFIYHTGVVFHRLTLVQLLFAPECETLRCQYLTGVATECKPVVGRL